MRESSLFAQNPDLAKEWHPTKNDGVEPSDVTAMSGKKAWWKCPKGEDHEWQAVIQSRNKGSGCPFCSGRFADKENNFEKVHPEIIGEWHTIKNGDLKPSDFTPRSGKVVWWKCPKGDDHEWKSSIVNRVKGNGCPVCSGRKAVKSNCVATLRPNLVEEWHPTKNGKLTPHDVTLGSNRKVWWKCPKGDDHEWQATVHDRADGSVCPICANRKIVKSNCLATLRPDLTKEWHPDKNKKRTPQNVHPGSSFKVWWKCKFGHEWKTSLYHRSSRDTGCPKCSKGTTLPELRLFSELKIFFPTIQHRLKKNGHEIDIYIPELNVGIEYDGVYWHQDKVDRDKKKNHELIDELTLIRIREKGLGEISEHDIVLNSTDLNIEDFKDLLKVILSLKERISKEVEDKINNYLQRKRWIASDHFKQLTVERNQIDYNKSLKALYPDLVNEWHISKNLPLKPENFSPGSHKKIWWSCSKGEDHIWKAGIYTRVKGHGCPICSGLKITKTNNLAVVNPDLAKEWHPKKNQESPFEVSPGSHKKAWWICEKDHEWESSIRHRVKGIGCPYCSNKRVSKDNCLSATHPELALEWHPIKNKDLSPDQVTYGICKKVWWKCQCGNEWQAIISNRARRGDSCPRCKGNKDQLVFDYVK